MCIASRHLSVSVYRSVTIAVAVTHAPATSNITIACFAAERLDLRKRKLW